MTTPLEAPSRPHSPWQLFYGGAPLLCAGDGMPAVLAVFPVR